MSEKRILNIAYGRPDHTGDHTKKRWINCGILIITNTQDGKEHISLKLDTIPLDSDFKGWFRVFSTDPEEALNDISSESLMLPRRPTLN